ncbi:hypothetical protein FRC11_003279, partial [Ceratobasidium sp. 423]
MEFAAGIWVLVNVKHARNKGDNLYAHKDTVAALDLSEGDKQTVIAFQLHGGPNQQWEFQKLDNGNYYIKNVGLGKYLTFPGDANNGKQVIATDGPREWEVRQGFEGVNEKDQLKSIRIFHPDTEKNLDLKDHGDITAGNIIQLWEKTDGQGQAWYLQR